MTPLIDSLANLLAARTGAPVERHETHISWILLSGDEAWKLKKPVHLPFVDFRDADTRRRVCEAEQLGVGDSAVPPATLQRDVRHARRSLARPCALSCPEVVRTAVFLGRARVSRSETGFVDGLRHRRLWKTTGQASWSTHLGLGPRRVGDRWFEGKGSAVTGREIVGVVGPVDMARRLVALLLARAGLRRGGGRARRGRAHSSPACRKLDQRPAPMMTWSRSSTPRSVPAAARRCVSCRSSGLGTTSPLG